MELDDDVVCGVDDELPAVSELLLETLLDEVDSEDDEEELD